MPSEKLHVQILILLSLSPFHLLSFQIPIQKEFCCYLPSLSSPFFTIIWIFISHFCFIDNVFRDDDHHHSSPSKIAHIWSDECCILYIVYCREVQILSFYKYIIQQFISGGIYFLLAFKILFIKHMNINQCCGKGVMEQKASSAL